MYVVGYNTPGYMPEMEPYECDTLESAREALLDELDRAADFACYESNALTMEYESAIKDLRTADISGGYSITVSDSEPDSHDLGIAYWIEIS